MRKLLHTLAAWFVPLARRLYLEAKLIAVATLWQGLRLANLAVTWWRRRQAIRALRDAQEILGRRLHELGLGEERFRAELARLEEQILNQQAAGASSRWLQTQRRGLLIRLAEPALAESAPPAGAETAHTAARLARLMAGQQQDRYHEAWHNLFPAQTAMRVRVLCGLAILLVAVYVIWPSGSAAPVGTPLAEGSPLNSAASHHDTGPGLEPRAWQRLERGPAPLAVKRGEVKHVGPALAAAQRTTAATDSAPPGSDKRASDTKGKRPPRNESTGSKAAGSGTAGNESAGTESLGNVPTGSEAQETQAEAVEAAPDVPTLPAALHAAAEQGNRRALRRLLEAGADPNQADADGVTALHLAALYGHERVASLLIERGAWLDVRDRQQRTPLYYAACGGDPRLVEFLLMRGADWRLADRLGWTPAALAVHHEAAALLAVFARRAPRALEVRGRCGLLYVAASWNRLASTRYLLEHKLAMGTAADSRGRTPLHFAAANGSLEVMMYLLQHGAGCDDWDDARHTPLHYAAGGSALAALKLLLERGAAVDATSVAGDTPLHYAAAFADVPVLEALLARGASPAAANGLGDTPLHAAAYLGNQAALAHLLQYAPRLARASNRAGRTPLHLAAARGHATAVALLLTHGARVDARDAHGCTPLHLAAWAGQLEAAQTLVGAGADVNARSDYGGGATPLDLAFAARRRSLVRWLRAQGGRLAEDR